MSPKHFCSFTFGTAVLLKQRDGWFGLVLKENNSSVACLLGPGQIRIADYREEYGIMSKQYYSPNH